MSSETATDSTDSGIDLTDIDGIGDNNSDNFHEAGYETISDLADASVGDLEDDVYGVGATQAMAIIESASTAVDNEASDDDVSDALEDDPTGLGLDDLRGQCLDTSGHFTPDERNVLVVAGQYTLEDADEDVARSALVGCLESLDFGVDELGIITGSAFGASAVLDVIEQVATTDAEVDNVPVARPEAFNTYDYLDVEPPEEGQQADDLDDGEFREALQERNVEALKWASDLIVPADGDYVGLFINMVTGDDHDVGNVELHTVRGDLPEHPELAGDDDNDNDGE